MGRKQGQKVLVRDEKSNVATALFCLRCRYRAYISSRVLDGPPFLLRWGLRGGVAGALARAALSLEVGPVALDSQAFRGVRSLHLQDFILPRPRPDLELDLGGAPSAAIWTDPRPIDIPCNTCTHA